MSEGITPSGIEPRGQTCNPASRLNSRDEMLSITQVKLYSCAHIY